MLFSDGDSTTRWRVADMSRRTQSPGVSKTARRASDGMRALKSVASSAIHGVAARFASLIPDRVTAPPRSFPAANLSSTGSFEMRRANARRALTILALIGFGAISGFHFLGATLTMLNAFCLLLAPALLVWRPTTGQWIPLVLAGIGFVGFFVSAQINHVSLTDPRVLQWPSFACYYVGFLVLAGRDLERVSSILCGIALGVFVYFLQPGKLPPEPVVGANEAVGFTAIWKFAFGEWTVIILLFLLILLKVAIPLQAAYLVAIGGFSLIEDFRSLATNCVVAAIIILVGWLFAGKLKRWQQLAIVAVIGSVIYKLVLKIASSGLAGDAVQRKTNKQANDGVPFILAGRTESPLSISAILDRPWFGWGSANNISVEVFDRARRLAISLGFDPAYDFTQTWYYPNGDVALHAVLFEALAEGGVFAGLLALWLWISAFAIIFHSDRYGQWTALATLVAVQSTWDLLFSPWSYNVLPTYAILAVLFAARHLPAKLDEEHLDSADSGEIETHPRDRVGRPYTPALVGNQLDPPQPERAGFAGL